MDIAKHIRPLAGETDWPLWKRKIRDLINYHEGALEVIDKKLVKPEPLDATATTEEIRKHKEKCETYRKANSYAKSMISSAVTDSVYAKIMDKETAYDAWEALKQQFEATSKDQLFKICNDFFAFSWSSGDDVSTHIAKLRGLWNELNNGLIAKEESKLPDLLLVCKTLYILPRKFETFRSSWMLLTKDSEKTFDELTMQLCLFERNLKIPKDNEKFAQEALVTTENKQISSVKTNRKKSRSTDECNYCHKKGHWVRECKKWIADGRPLKTKEKDNIQKSSLNAMMTFTLVSCDEVLTAEEESTTWWIDNGATKHVTNCLSHFIEFEKFKDTRSIRTAGKETMEALGKGTIQIISTVNNKDEAMILKDVWYVPGISRNLFSVLAAQDLNPNSKFESTVTQCRLKVKGKVMLTGARTACGTLYKAAIKVITPDKGVKINVADAEKSTLQLYHERWGHQDKKHVKEMLERDFSIKVKLDRDLCEPCIYGKAHRLPFGTRRKTTAPGELMSTDVVGPFNESFSKKRYFVEFKDSFTKFRYGFFLSHKSQVKEVLSQMISHAKQQGHSIKELLSDGGGEFDNEDVREILQKNGITQRLTAPHTPQQNGGSERDNRTVIEMARTFKYSNSEVRFPEAIWAELVSTAVYLLNRTGKSSKEGVSPYEAWMKNKPRIKHLRVVGSTCYVHIPSQKRRKMDEKAIKGYLIGYDGDERYRIYIKESSKVITSRDVQFQEKPKDCMEQVRLPLKNIEQEKEGSSNEETQKDSSADQDSSNEDYKTGEDTEDSDNEEDSQEDSQEQSERKLRDRSALKKPEHFKDYIMAADAFTDLSENPETFQEAVNSKRSIDWIKAMDKEMASHQENQTWHLTKLPQGTKAIPCKWVYRLKTNPDGTIDKHKARLVVKGYNQRQGIDYNQTFSPVAKMGTIRSFLSIAASEGMHLMQFDVSTAFLYGELEEDIYVEQPEGYNDGTNRVCKLKKSLYGLKQAPRCWYKHFGGFLMNLGFVPSKADPCLYIRDRRGKKLILVLYVDDGLVGATDPDELEVFLQELRSKFKIISREATYFLGLEIQKLENSIRISQGAYSTKILERFNFSECKSVSTPMQKCSEALQSGKDSNNVLKFPYRQAVGALMYLMLGTRPDLAYSVGFLSRTLENPSTEDIIRVKRVFRYIAGTKELGITYHRNKERGILECYSDADFGGCTKSGRSTSGVVIKYAGGAISWLSQRQAVVATSTTEAEIVAANEATKEVIWLKRLFEEIIQLEHVPIIQLDNSAAMRLAQNPEFHRRTKHIAVKHFFIRERVINKEIGVQQISTERQVADIMTKPLAATRLKILCDQMGLD